jgi:hypothetical protein
MFIKMFIKMFILSDDDQKHPFQDCILWARDWHVTESDGTIFSYFVRLYLLRQNTPNPEDQFCLRG